MFPPCICSCCAALRRRCRSADALPCAWHPVCCPRLPFRHPALRLDSQRGQDAGRQGCSDYGCIHPPDCHGPDRSAVPGAGWLMRACLAARGIYCRWSVSTRQTATGIHKSRLGGCLLFKQLPCWIRVASHAAAAGPPVRVLFPLFRCGCALRCYDRSRFGGCSWVVRCRRPFVLCADPCCPCCD